MFDEVLNAPVAEVENRISKTTKVHVKTTVNFKRKASPHVKLQFDKEVSYKILSDLDLESDNKIIFQKNHKPLNPLEPIYYCIKYRRTG